jgi:hypothetical protein
MPSLLCLRRYLEVMPGGQDRALGKGVRAYEDLTRAQLDVPALGSRERCGALHCDTARALIQDGPDRHAEAIRHLDTADRLAPQRIRMNPIARDLVIDLDRRARCRVWELDSLCNRSASAGWVHNE